MYKIYKITNIINGKVYVGYTGKSLEDRLKKHFSSRNESDIKIRRAIKKYGKENFKIELLQECDTKESALIAEIHHISVLDSYNSGYNSTLGGETHLNIGTKSWKPTSRKKMSESLKNWYNTAEGMALRKAASERFKILNPSKLVTPEQRKIAKEKYQKWLLTEDGLRRRKESSENMRKVQKLRYTGIYELIDPNGQTHITYNIVNFCKEHSLSYHSFYFLLKNSKRKEPNKNGKNKGWIIVHWNVK